MTGLREQLLAVANAYSQASGRSLARVATLIHDQGALFKKLEAGGSCTIDTFDKAMRWFSDHWPENESWPQGIARPADTKPERAA